LRLLRLTKDALEGFVENLGSSTGNNDNADRATNPIRGGRDRITRAFNKRTDLSDPVLLEWFEAVSR